MGKTAYCFQRDLQSCRFPGKELRMAHFPTDPRDFLPPKFGRYAFRRFERRFRRRFRRGLAFRNIRRFHRRLALYRFFRGRLEDVFGGSPVQWKRLRKNRRSHPNRQNILHRHLMDRPGMFPLSPGATKSELVLITDAIACPKVNKGRKTKDLELDFGSRRIV